MHSQRAKKAKSRQERVGPAQPARSPATLTREIELALARGEIDSACQLLSQARQLAGGSPSGDLAAEAYALQAFARWDKPTRAIASLERAIEAAPARAELRRFHGNLLRRLGMLKPAASELTEAHRLAPEDHRIAFEAILARLAAGQAGDDIERLVALLSGREADRIRAILAVRDGDLQSAQQAVACSDHPADRLIHSVLLLASSDVAGALPELEAAVAQEQLSRISRAYACLYLGVACIQLRRLKRAVHALEDAWSLGAPPREVLPRLAWVYQQLAIDAVLGGQLPMAADWFKRLAELGGPEAAQARDNVAYALTLSGQQHARRGDYDEAVSAWERALEINPQDFVLRQNLAVALERAGRGDEAIPHWHELVRQMTREAGATARGKMRPQIAPDGQCAGDGDQALRNHVHAVAHRHLADLYLDRDEVQNAIEQLERALKLVPSDPETRRLLAQLLAEVGQPKKAIPHLERLVAENPGNVEDLLELGLALIDSGAEQAGTKRLEDALKLQPDNPVLRNSLGLVLASRASGSPTAETALEDASRAVQLLADEYVGLAWIALGGAQLARGNRREADKSFKQGIRLAPSRAEGALRVGSVCWLAGDRDAAIGAWTDAMRRAKRSPRVLPGLVRAWALAGDAERCRECLEASLKRGYMLEALRSVSDASQVRQCQPVLRQALRSMVSSTKPLAERVVLARMLVYVGDPQTASSVLSRAALDAVDMDASEAVVDLIMDMDLQYRLLDRKATKAVADWLDAHGYADE